MNFILFEMWVLHGAQVMDIAFDRMHLYFSKGINYCINGVDKE